VVPTIEQYCTVVGVFEDRGHAVAAVKDLYRACFNEEQIGVARRRAPGDLMEAEPVSEEEASADGGTVTGAHADGGPTEAVGLDIVAGSIPVVGPIIAGGTLTPVVSSATGGAAIGVVLGALSGNEMTQDEVNY
jgi:hypothetical protein